VIKLSSFILDGKRADQLGLAMLRQSQRPVLPGTTDRTLQIPGKHGAWDFGAELGPRLFNIEVAFVEQNAAALQRKVSELAAFLVDAYGRPRTMELIFTIQPDRKYFVRYSGSLPIERISGLGRFTLPLIAYDPFAYSLVPNDEVTWGSEAVTFENDFYTYGHEGGQIETITASKIMNVVVLGSISVRPKIILSGNGSNVVISANGKSLGIDDLDHATWVIDCMNYTVTKNGDNALHLVSGDFLEFFTGSNQVFITGSSMNFTVRFSFYDKFV